MISRAAFVIVLFVSSFAYAEPTPYQMMPGKYSMAIEISDIGESYPVTMMMTVDEIGVIQKGVLSYPTYNCKATIHRSSQNGYDVFFEEEMIPGADTCNASKFQIIIDRSQLYSPSNEQYISFVAFDDGEQLATQIQSYSFQPSKVANFRIKNKIARIEDVFHSHNSSILRRSIRLVENNDFLKKANLHLQQLEELENEEFKQVQQSRSLYQYERYVANYPGSSHIEQANNTIVKIKTQNLIDKYRTQATPESFFEAFLLSGAEKDVKAILVQIIDMTSLKQFIHNRPTLQSHFLIKNQLAIFHRQKGGFEGYMNAFLVARKRSDIDRAYQEILASDRKMLDQDLLKVFYNQYNDYGSINGRKNFKEAKFINGVIWQDQEINKNLDYMSFRQAKTYCEELNLLGVDGWRLPSTGDFDRLGKDMESLYYRANQPRMFKNYFTMNENCVQNGFFEISQAECVEVVNISKNKTPHHSKSKKSTFNSVRCVLSPSKYNIYKNEYAKREIQKDSFEGYLNAFIANGNQKAIREADKRADTIKKKGMVEIALVDHFGINNAFSIKGGMNRNSTSTGGQSDFQLGENIGVPGLVAGMQSSGEAVFDYTISPNSAGRIPLIYGEYKLSLRVSLKLKYETVSFGVGTTSWEEIVKTKDITLSSDNKWQLSGKINFGEILEANKSHIIGMSVSKRLSDYNLSISIEKLE